MKNLQREEVQRDSVIDGLRGGTILILFLYHFLTSFLSFRGDVLSILTERLLLSMRYSIFVFFLMSGYCLNRFSSSDLLNKPRGIIKFYLKRFFRISPLYYLVLLSSIAILRFFPIGISTYNEISALNIIAHITYLHPLFPRYYLSLVQVAWMLGIEMYFYLLFPFLSKLNSKILKFLIFIFGLALSVGTPLISTSLHTASATRLWIENLPTAYFVFFYAGMLIADIKRRKGTGKQKTATLSDLLCLASIISLPLLVVTGHPLLSTFLPIAICSTIILQRPPFFSKILSSPFFTSHGSLSYAIFLTYSIFLNGILYYFPPLNVSLFSIRGFEYLGSIYFATIVSSMFLHRFVELPGHKLGTKIIQTI